MLSLQISYSLKSHTAVKMEIEINGVLYALFEITNVTTFELCKQKYYELEGKYGNSACASVGNTGNKYTIFGYQMLSC